MSGILAPSLLEADCRNLGSELRLMEDAGVKYVHIDVMDGTFVPNLSFGWKFIASIRRGTNLVFDVHLMVNRPERFVMQMYKAGANVLTIHYEACENLPGTVKRIQELGMKAGVALKPGTSLEVLKEELLCRIDVVHLMTVEPGLEGQVFREDGLERIEKMKRRLQESGSQAKVEVDGGINLQNVRQAVWAGADILVSGKALFRGSLKENIIEMNCLINQDGGGAV